MNNLNKRAFSGLIGLLLVLGVLIFLPAGSIQFWEGWIYLLIFALCVTVITIYFLQKDPKLVERRINAGPAAEKEKSQKIIQTFASIFAIALIIIPAFDHRFHWSKVPLILVIVANVLVLIGFVIVFLVFRENSFSAGTIAVEQTQIVISTGPYRLVRHPLYAGALLILTFTTLALVSTWGLLAAIPMFMVIVSRLLAEERFLLNNLSGYPEYCQKTKYHIVPLIW